MIKRNFKLNDKIPDNIHKIKILSYFKHFYVKHISKYLNIRNVYVYKKILSCI